MNTLEQTAAPAAPEASDLLDAIVQNHLERAALPIPETDEAAATAVIIADEQSYAAPAPAPPISPEASAQNLQREIESLLAGDPSPSAPAERGSANKDSFSDFPSDAPAAELAGLQTLPAAPGEQTRNVTPAELEVLLQDQPPISRLEQPKAEEPSVAVAASETAAESPIIPAAEPTKITAAETAAAPDELEAKLSEADGVMAEELAQLIAETKEAETAGGESKPAEASGVITTAAAESTSATPVPEDLAAQLQSIMDNPVQLHETKVPKLEPEPVAPRTVIDETVPSVPVAAAAPALTTVKPTAAETLSKPAATKPNLLMRPVHLFMDLLIMVLQILDLPFGWVKEPDKNVIGMIAFVVLLSGVVLHLLSLWMLRH